MSKVKVIYSEVERKGMSDMVISIYGQVSVENGLIVIDPKSDKRR